MSRATRLVAPLLALCSLAAVGCGDADADLGSPDGGQLLDAGGPLDAGRPPDVGLPELPACEGPWPALRLGGPEDDAVEAVRIAPDGRVLVAGFEGGRVGAGNLEPTGAASGFVRWYGPDGRLVEAVRLDTPAADTVEDLLPLEDGRALVLGRTQGRLGPGPRGGQYDAFVAVVAPEGVLEVTQSGLQTPQHPRRLVAQPGRLSVVGYDDVFIPTNYVHAWSNPLLGRVAWNGEQLGALELDVWDTSEQDWLRDGVAISDGSEDLAVAFHAAAGPRRGTAVVRLSPDGAERWRTPVSPIGLDAATAILSLGDDRIALVGATFAPIGPGGEGGQDAFVAVLDAETGALRWARRFGSPDGDFPTAAARGPDGTLYIVGETLGDLRPGAAPPRDSQAFAVALSPEGVVQGIWQQDGEGLDTATTVAIDGCGRVLVGGYTRGGGFAGTTALGGQDGFVVAVDFEPAALP